MYTLKTSIFSLLYTMYNKPPTIALVTLKLVCTWYEVVTRWGHCVSCIRGMEGRPSQLYSPYLL